MKKLLTLVGLLAWGAGAYAQCIPNQLYADSVYGVWPDTLENFAPGFVGIPYSDTLNLLVPADAGLIDPLFTGFTIDSVAMNSLTGLPPGISVICNSQTGAPCTYMPSQVGCGLLEGTPTQAGTFDIVINVTAYVQLFGSTQAIPQPFTGYSITITDGNTAVLSPAPAKLGGVQNVPNPFADRTTIEFSLSKAAPARVKVFNLVGEELWQRSIQGRAGVNRVAYEANNLENGMYIYHVEAAGSTYTGRMMVNR